MTRILPKTKELKINQKGSCQKPCEDLCSYFRMAETEYSGILQSLRLADDYNKPSPPPHNGFHVKRKFSFVIFDSCSAPPQCANYSLGRLARKGGGRATLRHSAHIFISTTAPQVKGTAALLAVILQPISLSRWRVSFLLWRCKTIFIFPHRRHLRLATYSKMIPSS